jgi:tetratricopeptide (TPR) repeat protein
MRVVAIALMLMAATSILASGARAQGDSTGYVSPEAVRRYALGRLLEERGQGAEALGEYYRALILDPRSTSLALRASELSAQLGDHRRSLELADRALRFEPGLSRAQWLRGAALFNLGESDQALEALRSAAHADSTRMEYLQTLARVAEHLDRIDIVNWAYRHAIVVDEFDAEMWFQFAASEARLGRFATADSALSRAAELNPMRPGLAFLQGWVAESLGRPEDAIASYRTHLEAHGSDLTTRGRLLGVLMREERWREAYEQARFVAGAQPGDPEALEVLADVAFRSGREREAREALALLERLDPDAPGALGRIVTVYARNGHGREANVALEKWNLTHPNDFRGALAAAQLLSMRGDRKLSLEYAERAVRTAPDSLAPRVMVGQLHQNEERWADAEKAWVAVLGRFPEFNPAAFGLAFCREQLGDLAGAEAAARDVLAREPDNPDAMNFIGYMLADRGLRLEEAERLIARALEKEPDNGAFIDSMGWVYYRLGRLEEARRLLERAAELTGNDAVVREHLGDVYKDLNLKDLAREQYRLSLATDGDNQRVRDKLRAMGTR